MVFFILAVIETRFLSSCYGAQLLKNVENSIYLHHLVADWSVSVSILMNLSEKKDRKKNRFLKLLNIQIIQLWYISIIVGYLWTSNL